MNLAISKLASYKNRWYALVVIALGLAIVIIDNTVLNVSIPYILRDLNTSFDMIQWVISGYALTIATVLITIGRLGDLFGRKKFFLLGILVFATGSFIGSVASDISILILGRAVIQAVGAAMTLTSALSLLATNFQGKERAIAFGIWGSVAGASATIGPLLGGYLTSYFSWRWSLRINVFVAIVALIGSVFIRETKGEGAKRFDWLGTLFSGAGLFSLVFAFVEGERYGWWTPKTAFSLFGFNWPLQSLSIVPVAFLAAVGFLSLFILNEQRLEKKNRSPVLKLSMFKSRGFSIGLVALGILAFGQFGVFIILPIYLENVLGLDALGTGLVFISISVSIFIFGSLSGFVASRTKPKWVVVAGMSLLSLGAFLLIPSITTTATSLSLAPALIIYGIGLGMSSAQLTNIILSSAPTSVAGEASATTTTMRQLGASIGVAIIGAVLTTSISSSMISNIHADTSIPAHSKQQVISQLKTVDIEGGGISSAEHKLPSGLAASIKKDVDGAIVSSAKSALSVAFYFILAGAFLSILIPTRKPEEQAKATSDG